MKRNVGKYFILGGVFIIVFFYILYFWMYKKAIKRPVF